MITALGRNSLQIVRGLGGITVFGVSALAASLARDFSIRKISIQLWEIGVKCIPLIALVSLFTGMVLGLQGYYTLARVGSEGILGAGIALTLVRELGPVLTAILVVGQAGSAMAAEIGIQRNSEQIDALKTMRINPKSFLIGPRLIAALIAFPLLTTLFNVIGLWGGWIGGTVVMTADSGMYWSSIRNVLVWQDLQGGYVKALCFGFLTTLVCCFEGFYTHLRSSSFGARGVSQSATRAVVISSIIILVSDYAITSLML